LSNQTSFWQRLVDALEHNGSINADDSSQQFRVVPPVKRALKMAVTAQASALWYYCGGAVCEHSLVKQAQLLLTNDTFHHQFNQGTASFNYNRTGSGMICGGEQTVLMYVVSQ